MSNPTPGHVLLVDDDDFVRQSIEIAVSSQGLKVSSAANAEDSLKLVRENTFNFAIIDVGMPGTSGTELCRKIRSMPEVKQFPILILSGYADKKTENEARQSGATDFLAKPFNLKGIVTFLNKHKG